MLAAVITPSTDPEALRPANELHGADTAHAWAMLLCLSSFAICEIRWCGVEESVEVSGGVALETALDFAGAAAFGLPAGGVGACAGVVAHPAEHDRVQRPVELSVA